TDAKGRGHAKPWAPVAAYKTCDGTVYDVVGLGPGSAHAVPVGAGRPPTTPAPGPPATRRAWARSRWVWARPRPPGKDLGPGSCPSRPRTHSCARSGTPSE